MRELLFWAATLERSQRGLKRTLRGGDRALARCRYVGSSVSDASVFKGLWAEVV
ncbi:hypothetical protein GCM10009753_59630 [Streptantibioticus ferralitis]